MTGTDATATNASPSPPAHGRASELCDLLGAAVRPDTTIQLPKSNTVVSVTTLLRREKLWDGPVPDAFRSVPNKPALDFEQRPTWAEFIILRLLERGGWTGAWVKNWADKREFWRDVAQPTELPPKALRLFQDIEKSIGARGGCWDVLAYREGQFLFVELKKRGRDRLQPSQRTWMEVALAHGVPKTSFAVVEWECD